MRWLLLTLLLLPATVLAQESLPGPVISFLANRQLAAQIDFPSGSAKLGPVGKREIDRTLERLHALGGESHLLRIEGFAASTEGDSRERLELSLQRALAVDGYLRTRRQLAIPSFLTGVGELEHPRRRSSDSGLVEIAVYPNPWRDGLASSPSGQDRGIVHTHE